MTLERAVCPECSTQKMALKLNYGWVCTQCNAGPYVMYSNGFLKKTMQPIRKPENILRMVE